MSAWEHGDPSSPILYLAQAPSHVEIRLDEPLVGPSGMVFNDCLHAAGLVRVGSYILNVWPYQVFKTRFHEHYYKDRNCNDDSMVWHEKKGFTELGLADAQPTLQKIRESKANVVVTMGAQAMQLLTGDRRPLMKWRGSILYSEAVDRKMIPTVHPAATIHGVYLWRYMIVSDFEKAKRHSKDRAIQLPRRSHIIAPTFRDVTEFLRVENAGLVNPRTENKMFSTDLEVINHQISCFSVCFHPSVSMTIPLTTQDGGPYWTEEEEMEIWLRYAEMMSNPGIDKINQNIVGFDAVFLIMQNSIFTRGFLGDTMIAQSIMYPEFNMGLDFITSIRTDEPYYKDEGKMWKGLGGPIEQFWTYCGKDGCVALESWIDLESEMTSRGFWDTYDMTAELYHPLSYMTIRGWKADREKLNKTKERVSAELQAKYAALKECSEWDFNPLSPAQCKKYFYATKGCQQYVGKNGAISTDDKALARIYRRYGLKEAKLTQEIRALEKLKGTYLEISWDGDSRLRCSWNPRGTWTGRLSSSQTIFGTGMNMQNLHPEFKEFLVADDDKDAIQVKEIPDA